MNDEFEFVCPDCDERIIVNGVMRETLIENGCILCGASISGSDFRPVSDQIQR
jgi:predicted RNA-binding Zn-ribbon protein involved in translation (DUF1610 family)